MLYTGKIQELEESTLPELLAFLLVSAHSLLICSDFKLEIMRIIAIVMAATVTCVFIQEVYSYKRSGTKIEPGRIEVVKL